MRAMILLDPAIKAGYDKIATSNADEEKRKFWFEFNLGMTEKGWAKGGVEVPGKEGERVASVVAGDVGQNSVHRAHFLDVLVEMVPKGVARFGKRVEGVERVGEKMVLRFGDGTREEADAVIGCDGVKSVTRKILLGEEHKDLHPTFSHKYAYRGLIPMEKAVEALGDALARNAQMYLGLHGHVLTFPIEKGKTINVVAFQNKEGEWEDERWVLPMKKEDMFNDFAGWGESVQRILSVRSVSVDFWKNNYANASSLWKNPMYGRYLTILLLPPTTKAALRY
jgi:salicylate hydroxylase